MRDEYILPSFECLDIFDDHGRGGATTTTGGRVVLDIIQTPET